MKGLSKKMLIGLFLLTVAFTMSAEVVQAEPAKTGETKYYTFGGSDIGGVWFAEAATLTTQWNADLPGIMWSADTRGGGTANAYWMAIGKVEAALNNTPGIKAAMDGVGFFKDKGKQDFTNVRSLLGLHKSYLTAVVRADSDIRTFADIRGKRVAVGQPGNSIQTVLPMIAEVAGWSYDNDFKKEFIADYDAFDALRAGRIDAIVEWIGLGAGAYEEEFQKGNMRLLPMSQDTIKKLSDKYPFYVGGQIPEGIYKDQPAVDVPFTQDFITVQASLGDDVVYQMCKTVYDRLEDGGLAATHRAFKEAGFPPYIEMISLVPLHPGAKKFYGEIGVTLD